MGHQSHSKAAGTENGNSANAQDPPDQLLTSCTHPWENARVWKLDGSSILKTCRVFQSSKLFQSCIFPRSHGLSLSEVNAEFDPIESPSWNPFCMSGFYDLVWGHSRTHLLFDESHSCDFTERGNCQQELQIVFTPFLFLFRGSVFWESCEWFPFRSVYQVEGMFPLMHSVSSSKCYLMHI